MADIKKRRIRLLITWEKDNPDKLTWQALTDAVVLNDSAIDGEQKIRIDTEPQEITRAQFRTKTGAEIEALMKARATEAIQSIGSGSGGHSVDDDAGD